MDQPPIKMVALGKFISAIEGTVLPRQEFYARDEQRAAELELFGCARRLEAGVTVPLESTVTVEPPPAPQEAEGPGPSSEEPKPSQPPQEESGGPGKSPKPSKRPKQP